MTKRNTGKAPSATAQDHTVKDALFNKTISRNGLRLITEEVPGAESFALGICIGAGSRDDGALSGMAHFIEHLSFRKTKNRTGKQISTQLEDCGAYTNAFTTKEITCFYVRALRPHFEWTLDLLLDVAFNPVFTKRDLDKERSIILEEIVSYEDDPEELIFDHADRILYGVNGLAEPIAGTREGVKLIALPDLEDFHNRYYSYSNIALVAAGCISHDRAALAVGKMLGDAIELPALAPRIKPPTAGLANEEFDKPFQQAHLMLCKQVPGMRDDARYHLSMLNVIFGDGMSCRLNQKVRERHGLAYTIYSSLQQMSDLGGLYIYAATDEKKVAKAKSLIFEELEKFGQKGITRAEFNRAKEQIKSSAVMSLESMSTRMQSLAKNEFLLGRNESLRDTIETIESITIAELEEFSREYFGAAGWSSVLFHPEE